MEELQSAVAAGRAREEHTTALVAEMQQGLDATRAALAEATEAKEQSTDHVRELEARNAELEGVKERVLSEYVNAYGPRKRGERRLC